MVSVSINIDETQLKQLLHRVKAENPSMLLKVLEEIQAESEADGQVSDEDFKRYGDEVFTRFGNALKALA